MNKENTYTLLRIIQTGGSAKQLVRLGMSYHEIAELINSSIVEGLIIYQDEQITLSDSGRAVLQALDVEFKKTNKEQWIQKQIQDQIPVLDKKVIFVPNQDELSF